METNPRPHASGVALAIWFIIVLMAGPVLALAAAGLGKLVCHVCG